MAERHGAGDFVNAYIIERTCVVDSENGQSCLLRRFLSHHTIANKHRGGLPADSEQDSGKGTPFVGTYINEQAALEILRAGFYISDKDHLQYDQVECPFVSLVVTKVSWRRRGGLSRYKRQYCEICLEESGLSSNGLMNEHRLSIQYTESGRPSFCFLHNNNSRCFSVEMVMGQDCVKESEVKGFGTAHTGRR